MDFGATGDGTTNDTAAIQAALTAVPAKGATVFFPAGTYLVPNGGLTCANPVRLLGDPGLDGTGSQIKVTADAVTGLTLSASSVVVECLNIVHPITGTRSASLVGMVINNANFSKMDKCQIAGFSTNLKVRTGIYYSILNSNFRDFVLVGLDYSNDSASGDAGDGTIQNCTFDRGSDTISGGTACLWSSGGGMRFVNNKINGKPSGAAQFQHGLRLIPNALAQTGLVLVNSNSIENFTGYGISLDQGLSTFYNSVVITANEISGLNVTAGSTGIYLNNSPSGVTITGNHIYSADVGINLKRVKHVTVSGNSLTNITTTGIHVGQFAKNVILSPQTVDVVSGQHVLFDKPNIIADPCWEVVIPFGGSNGSNMPPIGDAIVHDQFEITMIPDYNTVIVDIEATGIVGGNGSWAARQQRMIASATSGDAKVATIGTDYAYQGSGAVLTQTSAGLAGKVRFGVQKVSGYDLCGQLRIKVRGGGLGAFKQINRYN